MADAKTTTKTACLYTLSDPSTGEVRYCGWTSQTPHNRLLGHVVDARIGRPGHRCNWIRSLMTRGLKPSMRVVARLEIAEAPSTEMRYIAALRTAGVRLVNQTDGGEGTFGFRHSDSARAAISRAQQGKTFSPEYRAAISAAKRGKPKSPEHRAALSASLTGKPQSEKQVAANFARRGSRHTNETRAKMSAAHFSWWARKKSEAA